MQESLIKQAGLPYTQPKINRRFLPFVSFAVGMSGMGIEMAVSRLLTPYFGNSFYIWTNLIGIIMLGLTIGYWWGGKIADKYASERLLYYIILAAACYLNLLPWLARPFLSAMLNLVTENPLSIFYISFLSSLPLFVFPFAFLGMVTPYIIKLSSNKLISVGQIAGKVTAYSTLGSILGTFLPVFITIPFLGTKKSILLFAFLLIAIAIFGLLQASMRSAVIANQDMKAA